jgi:hypothetical protein
MVNGHSCTHGKEHIASTGHCTVGDDIGPAVLTDSQRILIVISPGLAGE